MQLWRLGGAHLEVLVRGRAPVDKHINSNRGNVERDRREGVLDKDGGVGTESLATVVRFAKVEFGDVVLGQGWNVTAVEDHGLLDSLLAELDDARANGHLSLSTQADLLEASFDVVVGYAADALGRAWLNDGNQRKVRSVPIPDVDLDAGDPGSAHENVAILGQVDLSVHWAGLSFPGEPGAEPADVADALLLDLGGVHGEVALDLDAGAVVGQAVESQLGGLEVGGLHGVLLDALAGQEAEHDAQHDQTQHDQGEDAGPAPLPGGRLVFVAAAAGRGAQRAQQAGLGGRVLRVVVVVVVVMVAAAVVDEQRRLLCGAAGGLRVPRARGAGRLLGCWAQAGRAGGAPRAFGRVHGGEAGRGGR